jgi:hypothetical protein
MPVMAESSRHCMVGCPSCICPLLSCRNNRQPHGHSTPARLVLCLQEILSHVGQPYHSSFAIHLCTPFNTNLNLVRRHHSSQGNTSRQDKILGYLSLCKQWANRFFEGCPRNGRRGYSLTFRRLGRHTSHRRMHGDPLESFRNARATGYPVPGLSWPQPIDARDWITGNNREDGRP